MPPPGLRPYDNEHILAKRGVSTLATKRRTSLLIDDVLLQRARKALHATTNREAVTRALEEVINNAEVETALRMLIRKGRGRFVDDYEKAQ